MSVEYTFRADIRENDDFTKLAYILAFLTHKEHVQGYVLYLETAAITQKQHVQGVIKLLPAKMSTARKHVKDHMKYTKGQYSIAEIRSPSSYWKYMSKDGCLWLSHGYEMDDIQQRIQSSSDPVLNVNKKDRELFASVLLGQAKKEMLNGYTLDGQPIYTYSRDRIVRFVIEYFIQKVKVYDEFIIKRFVLLIEGTLHYESKETTHVQAMVSKLNNMIDY